MSAPATAAEAPPVLTVLCMVVSVFLFIGINLQPTPLSWDQYAAWGAPGPHQLFGGQWWGLLTSNLLHVEAWHIAFNLYWLWIFGVVIERTSSHLFSVFLFVSAALISSSVQLAVSSGTGIGLSGVGYGLFGYITMSMQTDPRLEGVISDRIFNLFMGWLVLCIVLTRLDILAIGNGAHIGGLLWGAGLGWLGGQDRIPRWVSLPVLSVVVSSIFWSPLSTAWLSHEAMRLQENGDLQEALAVYQKISGRDPGSVFAQSNIDQIEEYLRAIKALP
jgi:GlpG protein